MPGFVRFIAVVFAMCLVAMGGCGGGESEGSPAGGAERPLEGRAISRASELVGVWMRVSEGELLGLEFLKDNQVIVTMRRGLQPSSLTMSYSLLDGGRLSVVTGGGATTVYQTTRSKDLLELALESAGREVKPQRFQRLEPGTTLAQGLREHAEKLGAERVARAKAAAQHLKGEGLVVVPAEEGGEADWLMSVNITQGIPDGGGPFEGVIFFDPAIDRTDVLRPVTSHRFRGSLSDVDEFSNRVRMTLEIAPAHEPVDQQAVRGRVDLLLDGPLDDPSFGGTAQMTDRWAGLRPVTLMKDKRRQAAPIAKIEAQREATRRALAEVTDCLGGRAVLRGQRTVLGSGGVSEPVEVTIERGPAEMTYSAVVAVGGRRDQPANGQVDLVIGRGALYVNTPWGEQWRLHVEDGGKTLKGLWRPNPHSGFIGHGEVALGVERVWTVAEVEAERAAIARFMSEDLRSTQRFVGRVEAGRGDDREVWPVTVDLRVNQDGTAEGEAWSIPHRGGARIAGKLIGDTLTLRATGYMDGGRQDRSLLQMRLEARLTGVDPVPTMRGTLYSGRGGGKVELTLAGEGAGAGSSAALVGALRGQRFRVTNTTISKRPEPTHLLLDDRLTDGGLTGVIVGHDVTGRTPSRLPPGLVRISAAEERGHALLRMVIDSSPDPVRGQDGLRYEYTAVVERSEDGVRVDAWDAPELGNMTRLFIEPIPSGETVVVSEDQRVRLAAQRMGAAVKPPGSPAVGDAVLLIVKPSARDGRVGQIWYADGRYCAGNSVAAAALHSGVLRVDEMGVVRLTYGEPFTEGTSPVEQNGVTSGKGHFKANNTVPTFTIERVAIPESSLAGGP